MEKRITKAQVVAMMMDEEVVKANDLYMNFLTKELEFLTKKRDNAKAKEKKKEANADNLELVMEVLEGADKFLNANEILKAITVDHDLTSQKIVSLLKEDIAEGRVVKGKSNKLVAYALATKDFAKVGGEA